MLLAKILDFVATISHQERMRVIVLPKRLHIKLEKNESNQIKIIIQDMLD